MKIKTKAKTRKATKKIRARYEAALLAIIGEPWRKWWLDQPTKDRIKRQTIESTHRKKLERLEGCFEYTSGYVDYNRRPEKSYRYSLKHDQYMVSFLLISFILLVSAVTRFITGPINIESDFWKCVVIGVFTILLSASVYLFWLLCNLYSPTETTYYVAHEWSNSRAFLLKSGLIQAVIRNLILEQEINLSDLEYCAERSVVTPDVSNAIHHAYRDHLIELITEDIRAKFKQVQAKFESSGNRPLILGLFEIKFGQSIDVAPMFFVPHSAKEFRVIIYSEACNRLTQESTTPDTK